MCCRFWSVLRMGRSRSLSYCVPNGTVSLLPLGLPFGKRKVLRRLRNVRIPARRVGTEEGRNGVLGGPRDGGRDRWNPMRAHEATLDDIRIGQRSKLACREQRIGLAQMALVHGAGEKGGEFLHVRIHLAAEQSADAGSFGLCDQQALRG